MSTKEVDDLRKRSELGPLQIQVNGDPKTQTVTVQFGVAVTFLEMSVSDAQILSGMINEGAKKANRNLKAN